MNVDQRQALDEGTQHLAPNCSPEHLALRAAAQKAGQNEETLRNLLWLINAHDRLLGLHQIATNLLQILHLLEEQRANAADPAHDLAVFHGWSEVLRWIRDTYQEPAPARSRSESQSGNPIMGFGVTRHPLYACLWHGPEDSRMAKRYACLQGYLLLAHAGYLYKESNNDGRLTRSEYEGYGEKAMWDVFPNSPEEAMRSVRNLAERRWSPLLAVLPVHTRPTEFPKALSMVACPNDVDEALKNSWPGLSESIQYFLEKAYGQRAWLEREGGHAGASTPRRMPGLRSIDATPGDADDPDDRWPTARWLTASQPVSGFTPEELLELDLSPEEIEEQEHWYLVEPDAPVRSDQQIAVESALAARGQCRHVQLAHQLLPWQYSQLTLQELAHLLHQSSEAFRDLLAVSEWNEAQLRTAELVTLIHVILWTGSSLERAWNLKVLTGKETEEYKGQQIRVADLLFEMDKPQWRMRPTSPPYKSEIPDPNNQAYPRAETFVLPDIAWTGAFLRSLVEQRTQNQAAATTEPTKQSSQEPESEQHMAISRRDDEGYFFLGDVEEYRDALKKWLRAPANDLTGRVTLGRIGSFLFNRLVAVTGDVMVAVVITGHDHAQARTQQFYATYSEAKLQEIYSEATADVVQQAHRAAGLPPPLSPKGHELVEGRFIGARLCAKLSEVQKAVSTLQERIEEARCIRDDAGSIEFHNLYTLYTVLFFGYATSMRAIRTPYIWPEKVDKETGFTFLSDKDDDAQHKTRLAWVPPDVVKQMQAYSNHISALASDWPDLRDWHDPCFFLTDNGKPVEVRPKTLTEKMRPFLALPPNAHRRFIRHELLDAGCPPEVVNGWLGHAFQGEEPWGPYSSFSFEEYQSNLKQYLLQVLKGLGWKAIDSPYV
jgi:hypothetical protein